MINLYIEIKDGFPINHPIMEDNLLQAFPGIDLDNLPGNFIRFIRVPKPNCKVYEVVDGPFYRIIENICYDTWLTRDMTEKEKQNRIEKERKMCEFASWIFNEELCRFFPPMPKPDEDKKYIWNEETVSWKELE